MSNLTEAWMPVIQENLFAAHEKLGELATDDTNFVVKDAAKKFYKVYLPQAGTAENVIINPTTYPLTVSEREDDTLDYTLDHLVMKPQRLGMFDLSLLSYDKMKSVLNDYIGNIGEAQMYKSFINWYTGAADATKYVLTEGASFTSSAPSSTASVEEMQFTDLLKGAAILDKQKIPTTDRIALLPPDMFYQLHKDLVKGSYNFRIIEKDGLQMLEGIWATFKIVMMPQVLFVQQAAQSYAARPYLHAGATTDREAGLLYHKSAVSIAKGDLFVHNEQSATYLGDLISAESWIGSKYRRKDLKGVVPLIQQNA